jgi:hypothetical protein
MLDFNFSLNALRVLQITTRESSAHFGIGKGAIQTTV